MSVMDDRTTRSAPPQAAVQIRCARLDDADALRTLKNDVVDATWGHGYPSAALDAWKARFASAAYFVERLALSPGAPLTNFFVAGPSQKPCGMIALKVRDGRAYIGDLYVRQPGRGVGRRLLRHAQEQGTCLGLEVAVADVFVDNGPAYALLDSEGFQQEDEYIESSLGVRVVRLSHPLTSHLRAA
jgi:ribosomal protein S18 acetylase RimI-like enzyme